MPSDTCTPIRNRWLVAAAAVGIHISIGAVYAYSVYVKPLEETLGWGKTQVTVAFSLAIGCLGLSAAFLGRWVERKGPRMGGRVAALFYGCGLLLAGLAVTQESRALFYLGYGVLGGIGLGVGYITPVGALVKWFPDRRGLATGLAIMGFGFGAFLGGPLAVALISAYGLAKAFFILGAGYGVLMLVSAQYLAAPPEGWSLAGAKTSGENAQASAIKNAETASATSSAVVALSPREALATTRFYLLWAIFFVNVTCGIALISAASPLGREIAGLTIAQATTMVGLMGLFNGLGRIGWSTLSDYLGRPGTYLLFFAFEGVAFYLLPNLSNAFAFQAVLFLIISCYGGGFATLPAYVGDMFGTKNLSAIYGYLLTAWSAAGILGPLLAAAVRERTGSFASTLQGFACGFVVAIALTLWLVIEQRRVSVRQAQVLAQSRA